MGANQHQKPSPEVAILKNLGLALLVVGLENLLIFSRIGFSSEGTHGGPHIPPAPGWIIGLVWTALFSGLGVARGLIQADGSPGARRAGWAVLILFIACAAYPFYTIGFHSEVIGLLGNILTIAVAAWTAMQLAPVNRLAVIAPLAVMGWVLFATAALVDQGRLLPAI